MAKETITCATWEEIGPALDAGLRPIIGFTCGLCQQRVAEEFHSLTVTTYHRVAEEECERLRVELVAAQERFGALAHAAERYTYYQEFTEDERDAEDGAQGWLDQLLALAKGGN